MSGLDKPPDPDVKHFPPLRNREKLFPVVHNSPVFRGPDEQRQETFL